MAIEDENSDMDSESTENDMETLQSIVDDRKSREKESTSVLKKTAHKHENIAERNNNEQSLDSTEIFYVLDSDEE